MRVDIETSSPLSAGQTVCDIWGRSPLGPNATVALVSLVRTEPVLLTDCLSVVLSCRTEHMPMPAFGITPPAVWWNVQISGHVFEPVLGVFPIHLHIGVRHAILWGQNGFHIQSYIISCCVMLC